MINPDWNFISVLIFLGIVATGAFWSISRTSDNTSKDLKNALDTLQTIQEKESKMKLLVREQEEFEVALTKNELIYIRNLTQNYLGENPDDEYPLDKTTRLSLFVGASRLLGYNIDDDGSIIRTTPKTR